MTPSGIITLTTDFGIRDSYVAQMKGVMLGIHPQAVLVDVTHTIPPQNICEAAYLISDLPAAFPAGTIHLVVVDPGVGTERKMIALQAREQFFVAPDNGVLSLFLNEATDIIELNRPEFWRDSPSTTFHGRDRMGPVAAHLAHGVPLQQLGSPFEKTPIHISSLQPIQSGNTWQGEIVRADHFGNLITNIPATLLPDDRSTISVIYRDRLLQGVQISYGSVASGEPLVLIGSTGFLEIAINSGNAHHHLSARIGDPVLVELRGAN